MLLLIRYKGRNNLQNMLRFLSYFIYERIFFLKNTSKRLQIQKIVVPLHRFWKRALPAREVLERWQSGRSRRSWKPLYWEVPGVRIPLSPLKSRKVNALRDFFLGETIYFLTMGVNKYIIPFFLWCCKPFLFSIVLYE